MTLFNNKNIPLCLSTQHLTVHKDLGFPVNLINDRKSVFLLPGNWQLFIWLHRRTPEGWINITQQPGQWSVLLSKQAAIREKNKTQHSSNIDIPPTQEIFHILFQVYDKTLKGQPMGALSNLICFVIWVFFFFCYCNYLHINIFCIKFHQGLPVKCIFRGMIHYLALKMMAILKIVIK